MPFQGNPRAGAPSTSPVDVLNLLFQQKAKRDALAYKQQQDAIANQMAAQAAAADEARKDREHRIKAANALFDLQSKIEERSKALGESQATAMKQVDEVASAAPVSPQAAPIVNGEPLPAGTFPLMPQDEQNANTQLQAQDRYYGPVLAQQAALANYLKDIPEASGLVPQIPSLGSQAFATKTRLGQEETQKAIDTEARSNKEADRRRGIEFQNTRTLAQEAESRLLERGPKAFLEGNKQIRSLLDRADKIQDKDPVKAEQLREDASGLAAMRDAKITAGQPEGSIVNGKAMVELQQRLDLGVNLRADLEEVLRVDSGGATAQVERFISNAAGLVNDFGTLFTGQNNQFDQIMKNANVDEGTKERLTNILVRGYDPDRQRELTTAELAVARLRWFLVVEGSRGRVSLTEIKGLGNIVGVNDFFTSTVRAQGRLKAGIKAIDEANDSLRRSMQIMRPNVEFDEKGRVKLKTPFIPGAGLEEPAPPTEVIPEPTAAEAIMDKNATPKEVVEKMRQRAMQRWGVK